MVALKVSLPHISLSRTNSPSRPTTPTTPGGAAADSHQPATTARTGGAARSSNPPSRSASMESTTDIVAAAETAVHKLNLSTMTNDPSTSASSADAARSKRAASLGALGAALRRNTTSNRIPSGTSVVAATPVHAKGLTPPASRPASDSPAGLIPLRAQLASTAEAAAAGGSHKGRSRSTDRRQLPIAASSMTAATAGGLASAGFTQSNSQPPLSRKSHGNGGKKSPVLSSQSGHATPSSQQHGSARGPAALHNLEESYVGKVSLKLGEAVNKVFLAGGGPAAGEVVYKGRSAARVSRTKDFGDMVAHELQAALHDSYLLRTLLRSSVLKSLSLFLTRLTALLLPADALGPPPMCIKEADNLNSALRFNLEIVRCAYELKTALKKAGHGAPSFVQETLRPWVDKLAEVMNRVMNPLVFNTRVAVSLIAAKARFAESAADATGHGTGHSHNAMSGSSSPLLGGSSAHSTTSSAVGALKSSGSQLRSLSIGRGSTAASPAALGPVWLRELGAVLDATSRMVGRLECGADGDKWLVSVGTHAVWKGMLSLAARRLPEDDVPGAGGAGSTAAAVPSAPIAKTSLFKTTKRADSTGDSPPLGPVSITSASGNTLAASHHTPAIMGAGGTTGAHTSTSPADVALIRLLGELELLESKLNSYIFSLSAVPNIDPDTLLSGKCPDAQQCGLCRTGRMFDPESDSDDEDDVEDIIQAGGLAQYAMREAMQALSALIVVVRASRRASVLREALLADANEGDASVKGDDEDKVVAGTRQDDQNAIVPLTPMAIINGSAVESRTSAPLSPPPTPPAPKPTRQLTETVPAGVPEHKAQAPKVTVAVCPTLVNALDTVPVLILLHLLASRLPKTVFRLPHEIWDSQQARNQDPNPKTFDREQDKVDWRSYEKELRGFQAGEEWTAEIAWEMAGEVARAWAHVESGKGDQSEQRAQARKARLDCLAVAIRHKAGVEVSGS